MVPDRLSFPSIPSEELRPAPLPQPPAGEASFNSFYAEALQTAEQQMDAFSTAPSPQGAGSSADALLNLLEPGAGDDPPPCDALGLLSEMAALQGELAAHAGNPPAAPAPSAAPPAEQGASALPAPSGASGPKGIGRLIDWLDEHAHLHSTHRCAAAVRQAMDAAGIPTEDRPASGDAGDYGPFLLRHGAHAVDPASYEPRTGDIAVFDKTGDHPWGHVQVFDGHHWVSDFVQHGFSPYRDQASTPPVTVYRIS